MQKFLTGAAIAIGLATGMAMPSAASAHRHDRDHGWRGGHDGYGWRGDRGHGWRGRHDAYYGRDRWDRHRGWGRHHGRYDDRGWRGRHNGYYGRHY